MTRVIDAGEVIAYRQSTEDVLAALGSDAQRGLEADEARHRLERTGPNELTSARPTPAWRRFAAQFQDTLVILLLVATAISVGLWVYERDEALPYEGLVIFSIVLLNGVLGYVLQARADRAMAALRAMSAAEATVIRSGERQTVPAADIVPVAVTTAIPRPYVAAVPLKSMLCRSPSPTSPTIGAASFSTGRLSPVSDASAVWRAVT